MDREPLRVFDSFEKAGEADREHDAVRRVESLCDLHGRGLLTSSEMSTSIVDLLTPENLSEILSRVPTDVAALVYDWALHAPQSDQEWGESINLGPFAACADERRAIARKVCEALRLRLES